MYKSVTFQQSTFCISPDKDYPKQPVFFQLRKTKRATSLRHNVEFAPNLGFTMLVC